MSKFNVKTTIEEPTQAILSLENCVVKEHKADGSPYLLFTVTLRQNNSEQDDFEGIPGDSFHYWPLKPRDPSNVDDCSKYYTKLGYLMDALKLPRPKSESLHEATKEAHGTISAYLETQEYSPDIVAIVITSLGNPRVETDLETGFQRVTQGGRFVNALNVQVKETHTLID